jgi:SAM-dependent methyltransferase
VKSADLKRYDLFGWDYELHNPLTDQEAEWYIRYARETGGPVLALACGTGRLLLRLAEAGFEVAGMDLSPTMLDLAQEKVSKLAPEIRSRITLHQMDMSDFHLDRTFALIFIADNSFRELHTAQQHESCLKCVYNHLRPGGKFLMAERRFDRAAFPGGRREFGWSSVLRHPRTKEKIQRCGRIDLLDDGRRIAGHFLYRTIHGDGTETLEECPIEAPILQKEDYLELLSRAGFLVTVHVGYEERDDDGKNPVLCFIGERR